jgi:transposase
MGISTSTISRYVKLKASGAEICPKLSPGRKAKIFEDPAHKRVLWEQPEAKDTATLEEHCKMFERQRGLSVSVATIGF